MLTQLLEFRGYCAYAASVEKLAAEMVESVAKRNAHVVCAWCGGAATRPL